MILMQDEMNQNIINKKPMMHYQKRLISGQLKSIRLFGLIEWKEFAKK